MRTTDSVEGLIQSHPFWSDLESDHLRFLSDCATLRRFASKQEIFHEGGEADHFYLILSGKVALETFVPGMGMVTIQTLCAGDALGCSWLFPPHQWHFTAGTLEPTEVISFEAVRLRDRAESDRDFRDELLTRVSQMLFDRLMNTRMQLIDVYKMRP